MDGPLPVGLRGPVDVALAAAQPVVPTGKPGTWVYEIKWDGFRCAAVTGPNGARLWSRQGKNLTGHFPDVAAAVAAQVPPGTVLDGEVVIWNGHRLDFDLLQQRLVNGPARVRSLAAGAPASYAVFDVLAVAGHDVRNAPLTQRRALLDDVAEPWTPPLQLSPVTSDVGVAQQWAQDYRPAGIEGLMAKAAIGRYRPGRRDWVKVKTRETVEVIVGAVIGPMARPDQVVAGRYRADGDLVMVGRSVPLSRAQASSLAQVLTAPDGEHPWPDEIAATRFGGGREKVRLTKVAPVVVAEVSVDSALQAGRWRHPVRFVRHRPDLAAEDVPPFEP